MEDITNHNPQELYDFIFDSVIPEPVNVILDLSNVNYINSFALGTLIRIMKELTGRSYNFHLINVNSEVKSLLKVTQMLDRFSLIDDLSEV